MKGKIKLLHVAECAGGVEKYLSMLLPLLEKYSFFQILVCSMNFDKKKYEQIVDDVEQIDLQQTFSPLRVLRNIMCIRKIIKKTKPDILYCHSSFAGGLGRIASIGTKCKVIYNPHGWAFNMK